MVSHAHAGEGDDGHTGVKRAMASLYWCEDCHKVYAAEYVADGHCPQGHDALVPIGRFSGMVKSFIAAGGIEERSEPQIRHRQLIHALWSQNERDQQFFQLLTPPVSLGKFTKKVDELHLRGVAEGWIRAVIPTSPLADPDAYRIEYTEPERFLRELYALFDLPIPDGLLDEAAALARGEKA